MQNKIFIFFAILLLSRENFAQNFAQAEITTIDNQKYAVFVNQSFSFQDNNSLSFKRSINSPNISEIKFDSIKEVHFVDSDLKYFYSFFFMNSENSSENSQLKFDSYQEANAFYNTSKKLKRDWLEVLLEGEISIYRFRENNFQEHFYIRKGADSLQELDHHIFTVKKPYANTEYSSVETFEYRKQLTELMSEDTSSMKIEILDLPFSKRDLVDIVYRFNKKRNTLVYKAPQKKNIHHSYVAIGVYNTRINITDADKETSTWGNISPTFSFGGTIAFGELNYKWGLDYELSVRQFKNSLVYPKDTARARIYGEYISKSDFKALYLQPSIFIRRNYILCPNQNLLFVRAGLCYQFSTRGTEDYYITDAKTNVENRSGNVNFSDNNFTFIIDLGVKLRKVGINARYERFINPYINKLAIDSKGFGLNLAYYF